MSMDICLPNLDRHIMIAETASKRRRERKPVSIPILPAEEFVEEFLSNAVKSILTVIHRFYESANTAADVVFSRPFILYAKNEKEVRNECRQALSDFLCSTKYDIRYGSDSLNSKGFKMAAIRPAGTFKDLILLPQRALRLCTKNLTDECLQFVDTPRGFEQKTDNSGSLSVRTSAIYRRKSSDDPVNANQRRLCFIRCVIRGLYSRFNDVFRKNSDIINCFLEQMCRKKRHRHRHSADENRVLKRLSILETFSGDLCRKDRHNENGKIVPNAHSTIKDFLHRLIGFICLEQRQRLLYSIQPDDRQMDTHLCVYCC